MSKGRIRCTEGAQEVSMHEVSNGLARAEHEVIRRKDRMKG